MVTIMCAIIEAQKYTLKQSCHTKIKLEKQPSKCIHKHHSALFTYQNFKMWYLPYKLRINMGIKTCSFKIHGLY